MLWSQGQNSLQELHMLQSLREETEEKIKMLLSPRKNGLDSLRFKEVNVFKAPLSNNHYPDLLFLAFWENARKTTKMARIFRLFRTPKSLEKKGKTLKKARNSSKSKKAKKSKNQGKEDQGKAKIVTVMPLRAWVVRHSPPMAGGQELHSAL